MKKPTIQVVALTAWQHPRADVAPTEGYALVVDGHFKTQFAEADTARKAASDLLAKYPMLQVEIYDASTKPRASVK
jgi:hypothetical protein